MRGLAALFVSLAGGVLLSGCIAVAAIPAGAALLVGKDTLDKASPRGRGKQATTKGVEGAPPASAYALPDMTVVELLPTTELPRPTGNSALPATAMRSPNDSYDVLTRYLFTQADARDTGKSVASVVMMPETDPAAPEYTVCARLPLAMVVDLGSADTATIARRDPALVEAVTVARMAGVTVHYTSDRPAADAASLAAALAATGLGPAIAGDTLWMAGARGSIGKDSLRWKIASTNCIVALVGGQPGDFSETLAAMSPSQASPAYGALRGKGWFLVTPFGTTPDNNESPTQ